MPIVRSYICAECNHHMNVTLSAEQWDAPPPDCPRCAQDSLRQEFKPPAIVGSHRARAVALAEKIAAEDYGVADMQMQNREGHHPKVRYKDQTGPMELGKWAGGAQSKGQGPNPEAMEMALAIGKASRQQHGSALDIIRTMPDMIANSKKISAKVW